MNTKMIAAVAAAALGLTVSAPVMAQRTMAQMATDIGSKPLKGRTEAVGRGINASKDPWKPVTPAEVVAATGERRAFKTVAYVDYNGDGVTDKVYLARNSRQGAVLVELGGGKGTVMAYKAGQPLIYGQQLYPASKRRVMIEFPESSVAILTAESGKPTATYLGQ